MTSGSHEIKPSDNNRIKIGIYLTSTILMGVIGVSGSLATIGEHFGKDITTISFGIISIPCVVIIPSTIIAGKLMDLFAKKTLTIIGLILIFIGGLFPAFINDFTSIVIFRGVFGVGIGFLQSLCAALVAEHFEGVERSKVQGHMTSAQMIGCAIMVFVGGWLGSRGWNLSFLVYLFAILSLVGALAFVPHHKPAIATRSKNESALAGPDGKPERIHITKTAWGWVMLMFLFSLCGHVYSNSVSSLVADRNLGNAMQSGLSIAFFCIGGMVMGLLYWKVFAIAKQYTASLGLFLLAVSYPIIIFANNIFLIYLGSLLCGVAFSISAPRMTVGAANAVSARSTGMAVSLVSCFQNFAMFVSPLVINPIAQAVMQTRGEGGLFLSQTALLIATVASIAIAIIMLFFGKDSRSL